MKLFFIILILMAHSTQAADIFEGAAQSEIQKASEKTPLLLSQSMPAPLSPEALSQLERSLDTHKQNAPLLAYFEEEISPPSPENVNVQGSPTSSDQEEFDDNYIEILIKGTSQDSWGLTEKEINEEGIEISTLPNSSVVSEQILLPQDHTPKHKSLPFKIAKEIGLCVGGLGYVFVIFALIGAVLLMITFSHSQ